MLSEIAAALANSEPAKAEQLATAALADDGLSGLERARLLLDRGLAHEQQSAHGEALLDFTLAIATRALPAGDQAQALFLRGTALDALSRPADALADYDASLKLSPASAAALNNRANLLRRLGRLEEARRDYRASLAAGNSQPEYPYYGLGQIAEAGGFTDAARGYYAQAVAANPSYRLAAERLDALGGPRKGAIAEEDVIPLRAPQPVQKADAAPAPEKPLPAVPPDTPDPSARLLRPPAPHIRLASDRAEHVALRPAIDAKKVAGWQAQLGSWRLQAEAADAWDRAVKRAGGELAALTPRIVPVDLPGRGRYYRLRVSSDSGAAKLCAGLAAKGLDCMPVRD